LDVSAVVCTNGAWPLLRLVTGAADQTVDHVVLQCPIHRSPHGLHGLTVLDDETIDWLLNTALRCSAAKQWIEGLTQTMMIE